MPRHMSCPDSRSWQSLLEDSCPPAEAEGLNTHLESCPHCQELLEQLAVGRSGWLREATAFTAGDTSPAIELSQMIARLKKNLAAEHEQERRRTETQCLHFLTPAEKPGQLGKLGSYEVLEVIGQGGMGVVLKAFDPSLHRLVAIKVLSPGQASSGTARQRFLREGRAAAAVSHDHVITIHAVDEVEGFPYLVMEYVPGRSLQEKLDNDGPLPVREVLRIGMQTAEGLAAAHRQGLVHRDVKPGNILLANGVERVKLTDFGLARALDDVGLTQSGTSPGTPLYMAPEQAQGEAIDQRADLFSLGSVLYAMCTGQPPFRAGTVMAVLRKIREESPRSIRDQNPDVPSWLEAIILKLLAKDPAARFATAAAVAEVLGQSLMRMQQPWPEDRLAPRRPRRRWVWGAAALVLVGSLVLLQFRATILNLPNQRMQMAPALPADRAGLVAEDGKVPLRYLVGHQGPVSAVVIAPDGKRAMSAAGWPRGDQTIRLWDLVSGQELSRIDVLRDFPRQVQPGHLGGNEQLGDVFALDWAPDGKTCLAARAGGDLVLFDWEGGVPVLLLGHTASVYAARFSSDGKKIASTGQDKLVVLWDVRTRQARHFLPGHTQQGRAVVFAPDGQTVWSGGREAQVFQWEVASGQELRRLEPGSGWVKAMAMHPSGKQLFLGGERFLIVDPTTGEVLRKLQGHQAPVTDVVVSPDGRRAASTAYDRKVRLWDLDTGTSVILGQHGGFGWSVAFSRDGNWLLSGGGGQRREVQGPEGDQLRYEYVPGSDFRLRLWDLRPLSK